MPFVLRRLDRYVVVGYAAALGLTVAIILVLYVVLDAFQRLDEYVDHARREGVLTGTGVILRYYLVRFLSDLSRFGEIVAIVPAIIVAAGMARANEFVAPLAAGRSLRRVALPVFAACAVVGVSAFAIENLAGPALARRAFADKRRIRNTTRTLGRSLSVQGRSGSAAVALSVERYDARSRRGEGFQAAVIGPEGPFVDIRAPVAVWEDSAGEWRFPEGARRWVYGSRGTEGAAPRAFEEIRAFRTDLGPDILEAEELGPNVLSLGSLFRQRARPEFASAFHRRLAQILAPLALALAALPMVLITDRNRVFQAAVLAMLVVAGYEVVARSLPSYVGAFLGGWLAPAGFGGFGAWRLARLRT